MHVKNSSYSVNIGVQGQCIISCKLVKVVQVMHAVREGPIGITQSKLVNFLINRDLIPKGTAQGNKGLKARNFGLVFAKVSESSGG